MIELLVAVAEKALECNGIFIFEVLRGKFPLVCRTLAS